MFTYSQRSVFTLSALVGSVLVLAGLLLTATPSMAANGQAEQQQTVAATVEQVNPQTGRVVLRLPNGHEVDDLKRGDSIAIVVDEAEEEAKTTRQKPPSSWGNAWRLEDDPAYQGGRTGTAE